VLRYTRNKCAPCDVDRLRACDSTTVSVADDCRLRGGISEMGASGRLAQWHSPANNGLSAAHEGWRLCRAQREDLHETYMDDHWRGQCAP
jgi:hypothetical protein